MISFIIPAHDEARLIAATLDALHIAALALQEAVEIIVVDDASSDGTAEIARRHGGRVMRVEHRHIAAARNAGAQDANGEHLVFLDADTLVDAAVVRAAIDAMRSGVAGGGATVHFNGPLPAHVRLVAACSVWLLRVLRIAPGCFVFCTRDAFDAVGGFDETYFAAEDVAMSRALARHGRFVILRQAVTTSSRKLRTHSIVDQLRLMIRFARHGGDVLRSRRHLDLWYGERRHDSHHSDSAVDTAESRSKPLPISPDPGPES